MEVNFLRIIREERNIKLAELSRKTGISSQSLSNFESGRASLGMQNIQKLIKALNISYESLFSGLDKEEQFSKFPEENKELLSKAMKIVKNSSIDNLSEEKIIDLSTTLYSILLEFNSTTNEKSREDFIKRMKSKSIEGLAAKIFLQEINPKLKEISIPESFHYNQSLIPHTKFNNKKTG